MCFRKRAALVEGDSRRRGALRRAARFAAAPTFGYRALCGRCRAPHRNAVCSSSHFPARQAASSAIAPLRYPAEASASGPRCVKGINERTPPLPHRIPGRCHGSRRYPVTRGAAAGHATESLRVYWSFGLFMTCAQKGCDGRGLSQGVAWRRAARCNGAATGAVKPDGRGRRRLGMQSSRLGVPGRNAAKPPPSLARHTAPCGPLPMEAFALGVARARRAGGLLECGQVFACACVCNFSVHCYGLHSLQEGRAGGVDWSPRPRETAANAGGAGGTGGAGRGAT